MRAVRQNVHGFASVVGDGDGRARAFEQFHGDLLVDFVVLGEQDAAAGLGPVRLAGRIDRIDRLADGTRVVMDYKTEALQTALNHALIEVLELKPRNAFGPLRTAVSGRRVSPPLFESMEILGKAETLARLNAFAERF